jgi:hypothetical protein
MKKTNSCKTIFPFSSNFRQSSFIHLRIGLPDMKFQKEDILPKKGGRFNQKEDAENIQHKNHQYYK